MPCRLSRTGRSAVLVEAGLRERRLGADPVKGGPRLDAQPGLDGYRFVAGQSQLGALLPDDVLHAAAPLCAELAPGPAPQGRYREWAVRTLAALGQMDCR